MINLADLNLGLQHVFVTRHISLSFSLIKCICLAIHVQYINKYEMSCYKCLSIELTLFLVVNFQDYEATYR